MIINFMLQYFFFLMDIVSLIINNKKLAPSTQVSEDEHPAEHVVAGEMAGVTQKNLHKSIAVTHKHRM